MKYRLNILMSLLLIWVGFAGQALATPSPIQACASGQTIKFAGVNWESGEFITAVLREILERGYGCKTDTVPGNTVTLEQALAEDDIQIFGEEWVSRSDVWNAAAQAGKVRAVGHPFTDASEGWYVPDYLVHGDASRDIRPQAPGLNSVAQLSDPRYIALFKDPEQPDKGRFLNCPSGWTCEGVNSAKLQAYRLTGAYVDFRPGTGPALDAAITSAYAQGQPVLFYYWSPSPIAGKLKLVRLTEPPYSDACWKDLTRKDGRHDQGCTAPPGDVAYGVSAPFAQAAPEITAVLARATFPMQDLNANLINLSGGQVTPQGQAIAFLKTRPDLWRAWVPGDVADRINASLGVTTTIKSNFPPGLTLSIRQPVNNAIAGLVRNHGGGFRAMSNALLVVVVLLDKLLAAIPWWLLILVFMGLAWWGTRRIVLTLIIGVLMIIVGMLGLWDLMTQTLTLMIIAVLIAIIIGLPMGMAAAKSAWTKRLTQPVLDVMQTLPVFVYLIPALMLFGLGKVPAILATVIYALPPMVRLTALGIERVDGEMAEAARAFGITPWQMLWRVELPLARPTIMAGVNQTIMLALSMVVVASMIGARGLGEEVLNGIQTGDFGRGLEAGLGIVILAFVLDRITQGFGRSAFAGKGTQNEQN